MRDKGRTRTVIACRALRPELEALLAGSGDKTIHVRYLDQNLHRTPEHMTGVIQAAIAEEKDDTAQIVLGYGLCSNGVVGLQAPEQGLIIPRAHDCISFFLGSREEYQAAFKNYPGAYYLTPGWIKEQKDPLGNMENDYVPRVGRQEAVWAAKEELKHYTRLVLIYSATTSNPEELQRRAEENARFFDKELEIRQGSDAYFRKILFGPHDEDAFLRIPAGEVVRQRPFLDM
ncbi:MAG: DUF1638 domain-containing protein [Desulfosudaceae bacterium]